MNQDKSQNTTPQAPIDERDILAWADGRIARGSALDRRIREHVEAHPALLARVRAWQAQNDAIRARYADALAEPVPEHLRPAALRARRRGQQRRRTRWAAAAGVAGVALLVGLLVSRPEADPLERFAQNVASLGEENGEVFGAAVTTSDSGWQYQESSLPDFAPAGFRPATRRHYEGQELPVTEVRYEGAGGERLRLFIAREPEADVDEVRELPMDPDRSERSLVYWRRDGWMYALSTGALAPDRLRAMAVASLQGQPAEPWIAENVPPEREEVAPASMEPPSGMDEGAERMPPPPQEGATPVMHPQLEDVSSF